MEVSTTRIKVERERYAFEHAPVNPLDDPIVKLALDATKLSGQQLISMSVKELNRQLLGCTSTIVSAVKKCRRTLKNRGYAKNCRIKRIVAKNQLELINARLERENRELKRRNKLLELQLDQMSAYEQQQQQPEMVQNEAHSNNYINRPHRQQEAQNQYIPCDSNSWTSPAHQATCICQLEEEQFVQLSSNSVYFPPCGHLVEGANCHQPESLQEAREGHAYAVLDNPFQQGVIYSTSRECCSHADFNSRPL